MWFVHVARVLDKTICCCILYRELVYPLDLWQSYVRHYIGTYSSKVQQNVPSECTKKRSTRVSLRGTFVWLLLRNRVERSNKVCPGVPGGPGGPGGPGLPTIPRSAHTNYTHVKGHSQQKSTAQPTCTFYHFKGIDPVTLNMAML